MHPRQRSRNRIASYTLAMLLLVPTVTAGEGGALLRVPLMLAAFVVVWIMMYGLAAAWRRIAYHHEKRRVVQVRVARAEDLVAPRDRLWNAYYARRISVAELMRLEDLLDAKLAAVRMATVAADLPDLPAEVQGLLAQMLEDGKITKEERDQFLRSMVGTPSLASTQKRTARRLVQSWYQADERARDHHEQTPT